MASSSSRRLLLRHLLRRNPSPRLPSPRALSTLTPTTQTSPSPRVAALVDEITGLTLLEATDLTEALRSRLSVDQLPLMAILTPSAAAAGIAGVGGGGASPAAAEEKKEEKTTFDVKLEGFDSAAKIKIVKEVRSFTDLGLKEAKDLVEKAPTVIKSGLSKEEADKIVEKLKAIGAKVVLE